ncbi:MAG: glycosyltransferase [Oscillospiraceae bacterium]|nr:glycosyltransferase [Oscillospiraceae bacterium]
MKDAERRLNELMHRRRQLQLSIARQTGDPSSSEEDVPSESAPAQWESGSDKKRFTGAELRKAYDGKAAETTLRVRDEALEITAFQEEGRYTYVSFRQQWELAKVGDEQGLSLRFDTDRKIGDIRPCITFYDRKGRKLSHSFFLPDVPYEAAVPPGCAAVRLSLRLAGSCILELRAIEFGVPTLQRLCDRDYPDRVRQKAEAIPESNGGRYYEPYRGRIGIIADEFLFDAFKSTADFVRITPENFREEAARTDLLLLASAWRGEHGEWEDMTKPGSPAGKAAARVIERYRELGKPVVFYSKEDPVHYRNFLWLADRCDCIFTSAEECRERYEKDCPSKPVETLCFGINPCFHNPVGICSTEPEEGVIFSGSWVTRYADRAEKLQMLFDGVLAGGQKLKIIDRNFAQNNPRYYFPERYYACVSPAIDHTLLQRVHKLYRWAININSVTNSRSMFANRAYELQANGNLLLSNDSVGMAEKFPGIFIPESAEETADLLRRMNEGDPEEIYRRRIEGVRRVMTGETTFDRLAQILRPVGLPYAVSDRRIAVIVPERTAALQAAFDTQSYGNRVLLESGECSEAALAEADIVAFWSPAYRYGPHYLEDMANGFKYTDSDYITKAAYKKNGVLPADTEHDYVDRYRSKYATVFWRAAFSWETLRDLPESGMLPGGYGIDHFELEQGSVNESEEGVDE